MTSEPLVWLPNAAPCSQSVAQQEISKVDSTSRAGSVLRQTLGPRSVKGDEASSGVGLQVIVIAFFKLTTPDEGVAPANHRDLRREVPLGVEVVD